MRFVMLFVLVGSVSFPSFGWDDTGHKITGYIAWQRMTPEVREKVFKLLFAAPEDSSIGILYPTYGNRSLEAKKREYFMLITTWADLVRERNFKTRNEKYHHSNWHYDDVFWKFEKGKVVVVEKPEEGGQGLMRLKEFEGVIRSAASDAEKAVAIAWIQHIIGDLHQPLHTSAKVTDGNPKGDQGGNLFFLTPKGTPRDKQENLHWFWDSIIRRTLPNPNDLCDADYVDPIAREIMNLYPYDKVKDKLQPAKFDSWAAGSLEIAQTEVFSKDLKWFEMPSDKYMDKALKLSQQQLALAGYRMGDLFNDVFGSKPAVAENTISCKIIRKVMYPVTKDSSVKQKLEISLLDLCPTQVAARPMYSFMIDGKMVMKEYDILLTFKTEADAKKYASENSISDVSF